MRAKSALKARLGKPEWLRGIGVGICSARGHCIKVNVREGPIEGLDELVPAEFEGVPTLVEVVGEIVVRQLDHSEARRMASFIHEQWPFIPENDAFEFYVGLGHIAISEGAVKTSLWCLKRVLEQESTTRTMG